MNSSGIKRGLALTAISALAVTGVPSVAGAATLATQVGNAIEIQSILGNTGNVSVVNDGTNTTVSLVATAPASVQFITFSYGAGTVIGTTGPSANGEFQLEWTPPVGLANTTVTATATDAAGNLDAAAPAPDVDNATISGTLSTVEISKPAGDVGYFDQPGGAAGAYGANNDNVMAISGTTSDSAGSIDVTGVGVTGGSVAVPALQAGQTSQSFVGTVDVDPAALAGAANVPDQVLPVLTTDNGTGTSDAQGFGLYAQQIRGISATQAPVLPNSNTTDVTVKVVDQNGAPVAGAHVVADQGGAEAYTNGKGEAVFANVAVGSRSYYVDVTNETGFQVGTDYRANITVGASNPETITFTSRDGDAFDIDEFDAGDVFINVKDAAGTNLPGQTFFYTWTFAPFDTTNDSTQTTQEKSVVTGANGNASVPLPVQGDFAASVQGQVTTLTTTGGTYTLNGYIHRGTNPGQDPADLALGAKSLKVGESDVFFDGPTTTTRQLETNQDVTGRVELFDGTALAGRTVSISYTPSDDSIIGATQPSGTTRLSNTAASAVTGNDGSFTVTVSDPNKTPDAAENGTLSAVGTATVGTGAAQKNGIGTDAGTAAGVGYSAANDNVTIQFSADAAGRYITQVGAVTEADLNNALGNGIGPGRPAQFTIQLSNSTNTGLAGQQVTLSTDHGFFTPNASAANSTDPSGLTADPESSEGSEVGEWASLGDTVTVTTDANGRATVTVAIERDSGFDDDGQVTANITATSGTATNTTPLSVLFRTDTVQALNPGSVEVTPAETANANNGIDLPDARGGNVVANSQNVRFNLYAKDQFGNLVADQVNISDNSLDAQVTNEGSTVTSQFMGGAALQATATADTDQVITATWNQPSTLYTDANAATPGFQPSIITVANTSVTDSTDAINWYLVDFEASTFTLSTDPEGEVAVGAPIVETVTVLDQLGKPVPGLTVRFIRQGPGDTSGDPNAQLTGTTNNNGQAFYAFTGTQPGVARVSAAVTDGTQVETLTDEITIVGPDNTKVPVEALISGEDNGGKKDVIRFQVDDAAEGATVRLFKIIGKRGNRKTKQVRSDIVPEGGSLTFKIADRNGNKVTRYVAKVSETDASEKAKSNTQKIR